MTTGKIGSKWAIEDVERLGRFMRENGLSLISLPGLKLMRHPQEAFYGAMATEATKLTGGTAAKRPTDEELLFNPMAGLSVEGEAHG